MPLPANFLEELRARAPLAAIIGRRVKLTRAGRNWKGCCPFHSEKTPSFVVYEDGYHCYGCGAHGDAVGFVMQSQGAGFIEAVEQLAAECGLEVPKPTPEAAAAEQRRLDLHSVLQAAAEAFHRRLFLPEGARALGYLHGRGLTDATIRRFALGWSGEGRGALMADLGRQGVDAALLVEAGLMTAAEDARAARAFFFGRVMFPIRDRTGRPVGFGGRILGDGQPKYLNGPETALFAKRRTLYGLDAAREGARQGAAVVAVEGYMDVIALHQAGFAGAVAPLGTALTEDQLDVLWRLSPMPVLCFDGDAAGARAAARAAMLALPLLTPERSLRLASLPAGEDPDTLVARQGREAFQAVLDAARPLAEALFDLLREPGGETTPEQRAALRARLEEAAGRIRHRGLAAEYRSALLDRFFADRRGPARRTPPRPATLPPRPSDPAARAASSGRSLLVGILLRHPVLLGDVEEAFERLELPPALAQLRREMLAWSVNAPALDSKGLMSHLTSAGLAAEAAQALGESAMGLPACAAPDASPAEAEAGWWHFFGLMHRDRLEDELLAASRDFASRADHASQRRLEALASAREALRRGEDGLDADAFL
jgi:DNA primase